MAFLHRAPKYSHESVWKISNVAHHVCGDCVDVGGLRLLDFDATACEAAKTQHNISNNSGISGPEQRWSDRHSREAPDHIRSAWCVTHIRVHLHKRDSDMCHMCMDEPEQVIRHNRRHTRHSHIRRRSVVVRDGPWGRCGILAALCTRFRRLARFGTRFPGRSGARSWQTWVNGRPTVG